MIVEGYSLHLYCDGPNCGAGNHEWDLWQVGGVNKRDAWKTVRIQGGIKVKDKVFCSKECRAKFRAAPTRSGDGGGD